MLNFFIGSYTKMISPDFGGYGEGIYSVGLIRETGVLKVLSTTVLTNPAYLIISNDNKYLYCITEVLAKESPKVVAFKIKHNFSLEFINEQIIEGDLPCHIAYSNFSVIVSCYGSGNVLQFPIGNRGALQSCIKNYQHKGKSINTERQEGPHAHQSVILSNGDVFVPDLGIDMLKAYQFKNNILESKKEKDIKMNKGEGPRHMVFTDSKKLGFVINELTGNLTVLKFNNDSYVPFFTYKTLPESFNKTPSASAIRLHPNNKFLYVANRELEAITLFELDNDRLVFVDRFYTKGKTLREFNIIPNGEFLIACHQDSDDIVVYKIFPNGGLKEKFRIKEVLSPVCVTFLNEDI